MDSDNKSIPTTLWEWKCLECGQKYWTETCPLDSETCCKCSGAMAWTEKELKGEAKINEEFALQLEEAIERDIINENKNGNNKN